MSSLDVELFMGPLVVGYMFGTLLFGMLIVQMFMYHMNFPKDLIGIRLVVWFSFTMSFAFTILTTAAAWNTFARAWGDPRAFQIIDNTWKGIPPLNGLLGMTSQIFFSWRIYQLTRNLWFSGLICCFALLQCIMIFYFDIQIITHGMTYSNLHDLAPINVSVNLWLGSSIACDLMITFTMIFILSRARGQSAFKPTLETLSRIINFTMETGLVTTIWAIIQLVLWVETPTRGFVFFFFLNRGRLYSNWLISTLNSRTYVTQDTSKTTWNAVDVTRSQTRPTIWADIPSTDFKINPFERLGAAINVSTTTEVHGESSEVHEMEITVPSALKQKSGR
ncbi:hypothetical protein PTI98_013485 [Pleurotus ostreatus]|nr:hypothetical protein PTI98_013485 [Pleurotus ostreatus]